MDRKTQAQFEYLAKEWRDAIAYEYSAKEIMSHDAYVNIVAMGDPVVPLILKRIENGECHWWVALRMITQANPLPPAESYSFAELNEYWLEWGRKTGKI